MEVILVSCELHLVSKSVYVKDRSGYALARFGKITYLRFKDLDDWRLHHRAKKGRKKRAVTLFDASIPMLDCDLDLMVSVGDAIFVEHLNFSEDNRLIPDLTRYTKRSISLCWQKKPNFFEDCLARFLILKVCNAQAMTATVSNFYMKKKPIDIWGIEDFKSIKAAQELITRYALPDKVGEVLKVFISQMDSLETHKLLNLEKVKVYTDGLTFAVCTTSKLPSKSIQTFCGIMEHIRGNLPNCKLYVNRTARSEVELTAIVDVSVESLSSAQRLEVFLLDSLI